MAKKYYGTVIQSLRCRQDHHHTIKQISDPSSQCLHSSRVKFTARFSSLPTSTAFCRRVWATLLLLWCSLCLSSPAHSQPCRREFPWTKVPTRHRFHEDESYAVFTPKGKQIICMNILSQCIDADGCGGSTFSTDAEDAKMRKEGSVWTAFSPKLKKKFARRYLAAQARIHLKLPLTSSAAEIERL